MQHATPTLITLGSVNIKIDILAERWSIKLASPDHGLECSWRHLNCQHETIASIFQIIARIICLFQKLLCWKAFPEADETSVTALADLGNITQSTGKAAASACCTSLRHLFPMLKTNAILHLIKKQGSSSRCQRREAGLKCTDLRS